MLERNSSVATVGRLLRRVVVLWASSLLLVAFGLAQSDHPRPHPRKSVPRATQASSNKYPHSVARTGVPQHGIKGTPLNHQLDHLEHEKLAALRTQPAASRGVGASHVGRIEGSSRTRSDINFAYHAPPAGNRLKGPFKQSR